MPVAVGLDAAGVRAGERADGAVWWLQVAASVGVWLGLAAVGAWLRSRGVP